MPEISRRRRDFLRTLALGASAAPLATPSPLLADEPPKVDPPEPKPESPKSEADARMELVLARFGNQLDAEARKAVRSEVDSIVRRAEALRKYPLGNGDGPAPVFTPYRAPIA